MFLDHSQRPDWLSTSLSDAKLLTLLTYQALLAGSTIASDTNEANNGGSTGGDAEPAKGERLRGFAERMAALGPVTLVLDEAHHLRKQWWRAIEDLRSLLPDHKLVALTATPPYDVELAEWRRYEALCGPSDADVPVPRLVKNGDLCPHQDYIYFSRPIATEGDLFLDHRAHLMQLIDRLHDNAALIQAVKQHPHILDPEANLEAVLSEPEFYSSMLVFLGWSGAKVPRQALRMLGVGIAELPQMSVDWAETFLTGILFTCAEQFEEVGAALRSIRDELRRLDVIASKRVALRQDRQFYSALAGSISKLSSIVEIAHAEDRSLGPELRLVVLADHIRSGDLPPSPGHSFVPGGLGVAPIFEVLRRAKVADDRLAVLTGSLVVVPARAVESLLSLARYNGFDERGFSFDPLGVDSSFVRVSAQGEQGDWLVHLVTQLFEKGEVRVLVGTQALLGEGWDAPTANSLVLATYVGSYMASNQMRGRVIRRDPKRPNKIANVWHLASVVPGSAPSLSALRFAWTASLGENDPIGRDLGPDAETLKRRFQAFEGVSLRRPYLITSGLWRLELRAREWDEKGIEAQNAETLKRAHDRPSLEAQWREALGGASPRPKMRQSVRLNHRPRLVPYRDTLEALVVAALTSGLWSALNALRNNLSSMQVSTVVALLVGLTLFYAAPKLVKAARLWVSAGSIESQVRALVTVVIDALHEAGHVQFPAEMLDYRVEYAFPGRHSIQVLDVSRAEESAILTSVAEVLGPIQNPRYVIARHSFLGVIGRTDYHAVPALIANQKESAIAFLNLWRRYLGRADLLFTRSLSGRRTLLKARALSMANGMQQPMDRLSVWE